AERERRGAQPVPAPVPRSGGALESRRGARASHRPGGRDHEPDRRQEAGGEQRARHGRRGWPPPRRGTPTMSSHEPTVTRAFVDAVEEGTATLIVGERHIRVPATIL